MFLRQFVLIASLLLKPRHAAQKVCPIGRWGESCNRLCETNCLGRCDEKTGVCEGCRPGWTGHYCHNRCRTFLYGYNCMHHCGHCREDRPCDPDTGICENGCVPGYHGVKCLDACDPFHFGYDCSNLCGNCRMNKTCNVITGACKNGCLPGWRGVKCDLHCRRGYYGRDCVFQCANCVNDFSCDHVTGQCTSGCKEGWVGTKCDEKCTSGWFGDKCVKKCGYCRNGTCDHVTGHCQAGCADGWEGRFCDTKCQQEFFGENCDQSCGYCRNNESCDHVTGYCIGGCSKGWHGLYCKEACKDGFYGEDCKLKCGRCSNVNDCDTEFGICRSDCMAGWTGDRCDKAHIEDYNVIKTVVVPVLIACLAVLFLVIAISSTYLILKKTRKFKLSGRFHRLNSREASDPESHDYNEIGSGNFALTRSSLMVTDIALGTGYFGNVVKGYIKRRGEQKMVVAVKTMKDTESELYRRNFLNELNILKRVGHHPNVVCLVGACHLRGALYVAMEYAKNGDLRTFLRRCRKRKKRIYANALTVSPVTQPMLLKFALDTATGMTHLADRQIIHRDVAARNVLLDDTFVAKIADFGLSKNDDTYVKNSNTRVPVRWLATESLFNNVYTIQSDVWAFGVMMWEIGSLGATPYSGMDTQELCAHLKKGFRLKQPKHGDSRLYALMLRCWHQDPTERPSFAELTEDLQCILDDAQAYMNIDELEDEELQYAEIQHTQRDTDVKVAVQSGHTSTRPANV